MDDNDKKNQTDKKNKKTKKNKMSYLKELED